MDASPLWFLLLIALLLFAVVFLFVLERRRTSARRLKADLLRRRVDQLAAEYPDEVQAWGGKKVLMNPDLVREIIDTLEVEMGAPAPLGERPA